MTLMKSILLGSAAGIVAVAGAQAADLPTKKAAPAEYVKVCNVGGMAGFIIPGSDTCLKIGGYITAQFSVGNLSTGYSWAKQGKALVTTPGSGLTNQRPDIGYNDRFNLSIDARQNTSFGVLRGYAELQVDTNNGLDAEGAAFNSGPGAGGGTFSYVNLAYIQWAGITAGKAPSFFSFFGGGETWNNIFSPDQQGFNQPLQFAYTATFGGGFSATIAAASPGSVGSSGPGTFQNINTTNLGLRAPDFVANVRLDQGWGAIQLSGVAHNVDVIDALGFTQDIWGYAFDVGVKFNLPTLGAGDFVQIQGVYTKNAIWFSGIPDAQNGENGAVNGNGLSISTGDTYSTGTGAFATPTTWTVAATMEHHFSPQFALYPEIAYVNLNWSGSLGQLSSNTDSWVGGAAAHWDPVPLLDFELDLVYQTTHQSTPGLYGTTGTVNGVVAPFKSGSSGFDGRLQITRNF
jgi:hypothetical protein